VVERFGRRRCPSKTGDLDVWGLLFNSPEGNVVLVRDVPQNRAYIGIVEGASETANDAELLLRAVTVFENSTSRKLYDTELVYLARDWRDVIIEPAGTAPQPGGDIAT
jgi:hypothetical protein